MSTKIIQVRDDTSRPTMVDVLARISARSSVEASSEDIRSFIENDRKYATAPSHTAVIETWL
ncbi:hypothetical protein GCM10027022_01920 [Alpinimonas psychrophila]|uniref:Uncharacterized protein n=1 Tax=Alpinimonas psychrophila TaxID=748908 RepID=A0A7W3PN94_9MICO|nr:hypothetical protein [Alpinimonas psychrophila]MBA8828001.1 hypothetical protein [Alpinimonas psychrophila]